MSRYGVDKFLYRIDKDTTMQALLGGADDAVFAGFDLDEEEKRVLREKDVATLYEWGVHSLLIRNFSGACGIQYIDEYKKRDVKFR